jgi:hypothetical protein
LRAAQKLFARKQHIHHQNDDDGDDDDVPINARKTVFFYFSRHVDWNVKKKSGETEKVPDIFLFHAATTLFVMDDDCGACY